MFSPPLRTFLVNVTSYLRQTSISAALKRLAQFSSLMITAFHPPRIPNSRDIPGASVTVQSSPSSVSVWISICRQPYRSRTNSRVIRIDFSCPACRPCFTTKLVRSRYYRPVAALNFFVPFLPLCVTHMLIMILKHLCVDYHIRHNCQNVYAFVRGIECGEPTGNAVAPFDRTGRCVWGASCVRL